MKWFHRSGEPPEAPAIHHIDIPPTGGALIMADTVKRGDIVVLSMTRGEWSPFATGAVPEMSTTVFTYYVVESTAKPDGVCHGHALVTLVQGAFYGDL